ncbi:MAG: hypothetical protein LQ348_000477 [Seirophora lacunosa]|nr:MAG: hypothetical protein LQ348_000477 [Seirophora lacunosa]
MYYTLARIEEQLADIELESLRKSYIATRPKFLERASAIDAISDFWSTVIDEAPAEINQRIQPRDVPVMNCLAGIDVERFEVQDEARGEPRSVKLTFTFKPNAWFADNKIEKTFYWRMSKHGWSSLVSEPVGIQWKDRDLTEGLLDMAIGLWKMEQENGQNNGQGRADVRTSDEHMKLMEKVGRTPQDAISIFGFFGFRGHHVTGAESAEALERRKRMIEGVEEWEELNSDSPPLPDTEVYPHGEEVAVAFSEDLYPGATHYFTAAKERDAKISDEEVVSDSKSSDESDDVHDGEQESRPTKKLKISS